MSDINYILLAGALSCFSAALAVIISRRSKYRKRPIGAITIRDVKITRI